MRAIVHMKVSTFVSSDTRTVLSLVHTAHRLFHPTRLDFRRQSIFKLKFATCKRFSRPKIRSRTYGSMLIVSACNSCPPCWRAASQGLMNSPPPFLPRDCLIRKFTFIAARELAVQKYLPVTHLLTAIILFRTVCSASQTFVSFYSFCIYSRNIHPSITIYTFTHSFIFFFIFFLGGGLFCTNVSNLS